MRYTILTGHFMKDIGRITLYTATLFMVFMIEASVVIAQTSTSTPPKTDAENTQEILDFRNRILDLYGIPHDAPLSIFDLIEGKQGAIPLPDTAKNGFDTKPLADLKLTLSRRSLKPASSVRALLTTFTADLQTSAITWYFNGKIVASGRGGTYYDFIVGPVGSADTIRAVVTTNTGESKEISKTIRPARIHLTWFADSYTPAWYRGKGLALPGTQINIVATPDFRIGQTRLNPADLIYDWYWDDNRAGTASGNGKNVYSFVMSSTIDTSYKITARVRDSRDRIVHEENITLFTYPILPLFYEVDSIFGLKNWKASNQTNIRGGGEVTLQYEPFYMPVGDFANTKYEWKVNGTRVQNSSDKNRAFRLVADPGASGTQSIRVMYQSLKNALRFGDAVAIINVN